jgi:hypothetical protein
MRIMTLGFENVGKTYYLASLHKLAFDLCSKGFSLQSRDFTEATDISGKYEVVAGGKQGTIPTTNSIRPNLMVLKRGLNSLFDVEIADIEGQAMNPNKDRADVAKKIVGSIGSYDALILILEAPRNLRECETCKLQLSQMFSFAGEVLKRSGQVPMSLVLNKIDRLPRAKGITTAVEEEISDLQQDLINKYGVGKFKQIDEKIKNQRGSVVNKYVKEAINTMEVYQICNTFFNFVKSTSQTIPNKVFLCTSIGFDRNENNLDVTDPHSSQSIYKPYGSAASLLWTIYASLMTQPQGKAESIMRNLKLDSLTNDLLDDVRELYLRGDAYFDPDAVNEDAKNSIWSLRNISNLRSHSIEE